MDPVEQIAAETQRTRRTFSTVPDFTNDLTGLTSANGIAVAAELGERFNRWKLDEFARAARRDYYTSPFTLGERGHIQLFAVEGHLSITQLTRVAFFLNAGMIARTELKEALEDAETSAAAMLEFIHR